MIYNIIISVLVAIFLLLVCHLIDIKERITKIECEMEYFERR